MKAWIRIAMLVMLTVGAAGVAAADDNMTPYRTLAADQLYVDMAVFRNEYEADRQALEHSTGVSRLLSIGRNGEFAHILMEDVYWRTRDRVAALIGELDPAPAS